MKFEAISDWIDYKGCAMRTIAVADPEDASRRVALIQKAPRVRIREDYIGRSETHGERNTRLWGEYLDWCEGSKGYGPDDERSRAWCDRMLAALGYV